MRSVSGLAFSFVLAMACLKTSAQGISGHEQILSTEDISGGGDTTRLFTIRNIIITGNRKTNPDIILRELSFGINEEYPLSLITRRFQKAKKQLMNTGLFTDVVVSLKSMSGYDVYVNIAVREKWYIWPQPFLKTVDKNFHQWWSEEHRDVNRINYGLRLTHNNFTGRNDKLKVNLMNGYTRQLSIQYYGLYLDNELRWSVNGGFTMGKNREVNYMTVADKPVPIKNRDQYIHSYSGWFAEVSFRPAIKTTHTLGIAYGNDDYADTVVKLNPYFSSGHTSIRYPELMYRLSYFDVDFIPYPTKGYIGEVTLRKKGFNDPLNLWQLTARGSGSWHLGQNYFMNLSAVGMVKLPFSQPYMTRQFIGNDNQFLQGYEYYVIDGVAGGYAKASFARPILNTFFNLSSRRMERLNHVPLRIYAKTFVDAGYVYNNYQGANNLTNTFLYSGGIGLDIITFTDFVIKLEWSFNRLGENGLYLHRRNYF